MNYNHITWNENAGIGIQDLGGAEWEFGSLPLKPRHFAGNDSDEVAEWLPARVPGNVRDDLLRAGRIPDPFYGAQRRESEWVEHRDWWYRRQLTVSLEPGQRAFVQFAGVDYISAVFAGGECLGRHEGMFSRQTFDLTRRLAVSPSLELAVRIGGSASLPRLPRTPGQKLGRQLARLFHLSELPHPDRLATLKCQMSYGWDFAPRLLTMGIWDRVTLKIAGRAAIMDLWTAPHWPEGVKDGALAAIPVRLSVEIDSATTSPAWLEIHLQDDRTSDAGQTFRFPVNLTAGRREYSFAFSLESPKLWQPWDRGRPHMYRLTAALLEQDQGAVLDTVEATWGIRHVAFAGDGTWAINGQREFIRGVNWVPADVLPGRLRAEDYAPLIRMARDAGVNLFRVWGGGLREKEAFYDACDRAGILVWQEFPIASVFLGRLPHTREYLNLLRQESEDIVRTLHRHPSLALWCGGNEFNPARNRPVVEVLAESVSRLDGTRPFLPASPYDGDRHNWDVWHGKAPAAEYRRDKAAFASEFGLQAAPDAESLKRFLPPVQLWPAGGGWEDHHAQLEKLHRYADIFPWRGLESFVAATQRTQARSLQIAIEHFRRRKGECAGLAIWQWNEPWPAISWSLVDYYRQPKLAGRLLDQWLAPLLASLDYPLKVYRAGDEFEADLWIVNDWGESFSDCQVHISQAGKRLWSAAADIGADESRRVDHVALQLVDPSIPLEVDLWQGSRRLTHNDYDLSYYDPRHMSAWRRLRRRLAEWLLSR